MTANQAQTKMYATQAIALGQMTKLTKKTGLMHEVVMGTQVDGANWEVRPVCEKAHNIGRAQLLMSEPVQSIAPAFESTEPHLQYGPAQPSPSQSSRDRMIQVTGTVVKNLTKMVVVDFSDRKGVYLEHRLIDEIWAPSWQPSEQVSFKLKAKYVKSNGLVSFLAA
jgi:hypothetical protein